ncbi:MAG: rubredoxin [Pseudomonadota bacterium]
MSSVELTTGVPSTSGVCYECGVCWTVYDPSKGDDFAQVSCGTAFEQLPSNWTCPHCDAPKTRFLRVPA